MAITTESTVLEIFEETSWPWPSDADLEAWNELDCGSADMCGDPAGDGYMGA